MRSTRTVTDFAGSTWTPRCSPNGAGESPFIVSLVLLVFSVYIRLRLSESLIFMRMKEEGKGSKAPLTDSFLRYPNNKYVLLALLGPPPAKALSGTRVSSTPCSSC